VLSRVYVYPRPTNQSRKKMMIMVQSMGFLLWVGCWSARNGTVLRTRLLLYCAAAGEQVEDDEDDGDDEEEMNPCAEDMKSDEANQPE
jgi:hypothetical protein